MGCEMMDELKTSEEWQVETQDVYVHDPDGWDRKNFMYSWYEEKITWDEYERRRIQSTVGHRPK